LPSGITASTTESLRVDGTGASNLSTSCTNASRYSSELRVSLKKGLAVQRCGTCLGRL
jgi:hypothetical protein